MEYLGHAWGPSFIRYHSIGSDVTKAMYSYLFIGSSDQYETFGTLAFCIALSRTASTLRTNNMKSWRFFRSLLESSKRFRNYFYNSITLNCGLQYDVLFRPLSIILCSEHTKLLRFELYIFIAPRPGISSFRTQKLYQNYETHLPGGKVLEILVMLPNAVPIKYSFIKFIPS